MSDKRDTPMRLVCATDPAWVACALADLGAVLVDHAHCEKKAASTALSLLSTYPEVPGLPLQMAKLAREESSHLARVLVFLERRGLSLGKDPGDPYAQRLVATQRNPAPLRRLDRLLVAGIIEARSCERLELLAGALPDEELSSFYRELAQSEHGHQELFLRLAEEAGGQEPAHQRLAELLQVEAELVRTLPIVPRIH